LDAAAGEVVEAATGAAVGAGAAGGAGSPGTMVAGAGVGAGMGGMVGRTLTTTTSTRTGGARSVDSRLSSSCSRGRCTPVRHHRGHALRRRYGRAVVGTHTHRGVGITIAEGTPWISDSHRWIFYLKAHGSHSAYGPSRYFGSKGAALTAAKQKIDEQKAP